MNYSLLLAYIIAIVVLIGTPGPIVALVINAASRHGFRYALSTVLGSNLASLTLLAAAALIVSGVIALDGNSLQWISLLGCGFIGWMAVQGLRTELTQKKTQPTATSRTTVRRHSGFFNGFFLGISNPKDIVFFVAFFPQFISVSSDLVDFVILLSYAVLMGGGFFQQHKRSISLLSSAFLLLIALLGIIYTLVGWNA